MCSNNKVVHLMPLCVAFYVEARFTPFAARIFSGCVCAYAFRQQFHASAHLGRTCFVLSYFAGPRTGDG